MRNEIKQDPAQLPQHITSRPENDFEMNLNIDSSEVMLLNEISSRDDSFKNGKIFLTTIDELSIRLKNRRNSNVL